MPTKEARVAQKRMWFSAHDALPDDRELIIDSFAGAGGASLGIKLALGREPDLAVNHSYDALTVHELNHGETHHVLEDVWKADLQTLVGGRPVGLLWASPDCRHFSRAKGSKPVRKNVRSLAWVVVKWAAQVAPRVIILENVREFLDWGPVVPVLDENGSPVFDRHGRPLMRPDPLRKGQTFKRFVRELRKLGYHVEWRALNAADYGAPTHRRRLFLIARRDGEPVVWPEPTHGPGRPHPWHTAAECIDWSIPCRSIFDREKPLADKTLRRIALGLMRYVLNCPRPFVVHVNHGGEHFRGQQVEQPLATVTAHHGYGLVTPYLSMFHHAKGDESRCRPVDEPANTLDTQPRFGLVTPFVSRLCQNGGNGKYVNGADEPLTTIVSKAEHCLVAPALVQIGYGERDGQAPRALDLEQPLGTVVAGGQKHALVAAMLVGAGGSGYAGKPRAVDRPAGVVKCDNHQAVAAAYLARFNHGDKQWNGVGEPLGTVTSQGNKFGLVYAFLTKYFGQGVGQPVTEPAHTVTTKDRFGLVTIEVEPGRCETAVALDVEGVGPCVIADIGLRMLTPRELARAQGFPDSYRLVGPNSLQVELIGNSVPPPIVREIVRANVEIRRICG